MFGRSSGIRPEALAAFLVAGTVVGSLLAHPAGAVTKVWVNASGGAWSAADNWKPSGAPAAGDDAVLPTMSGAYQVDLDVAPEAASLDVDAGAALDLSGNTLDGIAFTRNYGALRNFTGLFDAYRVQNFSGGTIDVAEYGTMSMTPTITNDGVITVGPNATLSAYGPLSFSGSGALHLAGNGRVISPNTPNVPSDMMTIGTNFTVRGAGFIGMYVTVAGRLEGDGNDGNLIRIDGLVYNYGTIYVHDNGGINVNRPLVKNHGRIVGGPGGGKFTVIMPYDMGGMIDNMARLPNGQLSIAGVLISDGGDLTIKCGSLVEGEIQRASGTGTVDVMYGAPQDLHVAAGADMTVSGSIDLMAHGSSLVNDGTIHLTGRLNVGARPGFSIPLTGSGTLVLDGGILDTSVGGTMVNDVHHTISGCGTIMANLVNLGTIDVSCDGGLFRVTERDLLNKSLMKVSRGTLWLTGTSGHIVNNGGRLSVAGGKVWMEKGATLANTGGVFSVDAGTVLLGMRTSCTIEGGRIDGGSGGQIMNLASATLKNVTLGAGANFLTYQGGTTLVTGRFVNQGVNRIAQGGVLAVDAGTDYVQSAGATVLEGGALNAARALQIQGGSLRGKGVIAADVVNGGTVSPDAASTLQVRGNYTQLAGGRLDVGLGGASSDRVSRLAVSGAVQLDGALQATTVQAFKPSPGSRYEVLSYGALDGRFAHLTATDEGSPLDVMPLYGDAGLVLQMAGTLAVGDPARSPATLRFYGLRDGRGAGFGLELPHAADVSVEAFDVSGRSVGVLASGHREAGAYRFGLSGGSSAGMYFARLVLRGAAETTSRTARVVLVK